MFEFVNSLNRLEYLVASLLFFTARSAYSCIVSVYAPITPPSIITLRFVPSVRVIVAAVLATLLHAATESRRHR